MTMATLNSKPLSPFAVALYMGLTVGELHRLEVSFALDPTIVNTIRLPVIAADTVEPLAAKAIDTIESPISTATTVTGRVAVVAVSTATITSSVIVSDIRAVPVKMRSKAPCVHATTLPKSILVPGTPAFATAPSAEPRYRSITPKQTTPFIDIVYNTPQTGSSEGSSSFDNACGSPLAKSSEGSVGSARSSLLVVGADGSWSRELESSTAVPEQNSGFDATPTSIEEPESRPRKDCAARKRRAVERGPRKPRVATQSIIRRPTRETLPDWMLSRDFQPSGMTNEMEPIWSCPLWTCTYKTKNRLNILVHWHGRKGHSRTYVERMSEQYWKAPGAVHDMEENLLSDGEDREPEDEEPELDALFDFAAFEDFPGPSHQHDNHDHDGHTGGGSGLGAICMVPGGQYM